MSEHAQPPTKLNQFWWTTSTAGQDTQTFLTSGTAIFITSGGSTFQSSTSATSTGDAAGSSVTTTPTTATDSAAVTSGLPTAGLSTSTSDPFSSSFPSASSSFPVRPTTSSVIPFDPTPVVAAQAGPICIGEGIDAAAGGLLSSLLIPSVIGLIIWLLFAIVRPRYRQLYAVREWFVQQDLRPKPLGSSLWAFLFPPVPLVPGVPSDVSDAGRSNSNDALLFPSDEQISQRTLWIALLVIAGWSFLALAGALPLYLVSTTCLARAASRAQYGGVYSTVQDLSLLRLLQRLDDERSGQTPGALMKRAEGSPGLSNARIRIIVLSALVIVLATLPALYKILKEFRRIAEFRTRWIETRCEGIEIGWLSAKRAPGFATWGEKRVKDYFVKNGLSTSLDNNSTSGTNGKNRRGHKTQPSEIDEKHSEVDVQSLFTICNTHKVAALIGERDLVLERLEIAEARYIESFKSVTPDPSVADFFTEESDPARPSISRPRPLVTARRRMGRARNTTQGSSGYAPSSYMLPSSFYKLRRIEGVSTPLVSSTGELVSPAEPSLADSIRQRVVGSRFQEVHNRPSVVWGRLPMGSYVRPDENGVLHPVEGASEVGYVPDPAHFGPNHDGREENNNDASHLREESDWVDLMRERDENAENSWYASAQSAPSEGPESTAVQTPRPRDQSMSLDAQTAAAQSDPQRRPLIWNYPASHRSTFPMRPERYSELEPSLVPAPHLRLQSRGPFFRPVSGLAHDELSTIYMDISHWRSQLKELNTKISETQNDLYGDIAEGKDVKGWLLIGRGVRFLPGVQMIEGRSKEDIRWKELQNEGGTWNKVAIVVLCIFVMIALAAGLFAAAGLSLGTAPNFAHYVKFLQPLQNQNDWTSGLVTGFSAALAGSVFLVIAVAFLHFIMRLSTKVSISAWELASFQLIFWALTIVGFVFLTVVGSLMFAVRAFDTNTQRSATIANGSIYMTALLLALVFNVAIIAPGLLMLQPFRLWSIRRAEPHIITPRHRFRLIYPRSYNPIFAMGCCLFAIIIACAFTLLFPLIGPAVVLLVLLTLIAHRFLIGYVYARTHSQTGGLLQLWLLRRFATLTSLQPLILGLILLSRRLWIEGGVLCGFAVGVIILAEVYCSRKLRQPGLASLGPTTRHHIETFGKAAKPNRNRNTDDESTDLVAENGGMNPRARGSFASVLEMMSITLAVTPSSHFRGPVPLPTETIDDLTATERAARSHPDAPPFLPSLSFADHADELAGILYAPELIAPPPTIWLANDRAGVARSEAYDLQQYHGLRATVDVRSKDDVLVPRDHDERRRTSGEKKGVRRASKK